MELTIEGLALPGRSCPPYRDVQVGIQRTGGEQ